MVEGSVRLYAGQGGRSVQALEVLARQPGARDLLAEVGRGCAQYGIGSGSGAFLSAEASPDADWSLAAAFAAAVASDRLIGPPKPADVVVGHSGGEIAGLVAAGVLDLDTGVRVVCTRARALRENAAEAGGMRAFEAGLRRTRAMVDALGDPAVAVAAVNAPRLTVVAGPLPSLAKLKEAASALGIPSVRVNAPYPFHSPLLRAAADRFAAAVEKIPAGRARARVYSPIEGRFYQDDNDFAALLPTHLFRPVRFMDAIRELYAAGYDEFIECSPAATLSKLVSLTVPRAVTGLAADGAESAPSPGAQDTAEAAVADPPDAGRNGADRPAGGRPEAGGGRNEDSSGGAGNADRETVLRELREFYARELDYPEDVISEDADLEADLGVDSIQQTELFVRTAARYHLGEAGENVDITEYPTLASLADFVVRRMNREPEDAK